MSEEKFDLPFTSPVVPELLNNDSKISFRCYPGISCFNACCKQADITLTPYDILRMKKHLGMSTTDILAKHTVPFQMDAHGLPGIKLRTQDDKPQCLFMVDEGCGIYANRPSACRYYPVGLLPLRRTGVNQDEHHYCIVQEDHCRGHDEDNRLTIGQYREEQGVVEYDDMNREWYQIILKKRSAGPAIGKPPEMTFQLFFMASYDIDRFRRFVTSDSFKKTYTLDEVTYKSFEDNDVALMKFGFKLMKQVFFGEMTIPTKEGAVEERIEKRKEVIELRRQAEIEQHKKKNDAYENMEK
jgi:Fe-S-cluster containining protein